MRAIGYYRLGDEQGHPACEQAQAEFEEYCERYLHQPVAIFVDEAGVDDAGAGGNGGGGRRPEYRRMLAHIREPGSNFLVVVRDAGQLGDTLEEVTRAVIEIEATGCKVTCDDDDLPDPLQNALESMGVAGVSKRRSDRIKESMRERAVMGKGLGKPPYGYRNGADGSLEVVADEAPVVELIYAKYTRDKLGLRLIAQHLNERGIPTRRGGLWNMVTIRDILKNPTYMGTYTRFGLRVPRSHEAIIPSDVFRAAQDQTRARRPSIRSANAEPFLLSGLAFCGYCGNKMMGVTRRQSWRRKDGRSARGVYRYYQCQTRNNQSLCGYHTWRAGRMEEEVMAQLAASARREPAGAASGRGSGGGRRADVKAIWDGRVKNAERRFLLNLKRAARGEFGVAALVEHLDGLDKARVSAANSDGAMDARALLERWDMLDLDNRQAFLMTHIAKIVVWDKSVEVLT